MVENPIINRNHHDSCHQDFEHYCSECDGEIYFGMTYYEFEGNHICEECSERFLQRHATRFTAGE